MQADVAQLVEQPIRNRQVIGSSPIVGSSFTVVRLRFLLGLANRPAAISMECQPIGRAGFYSLWKLLAVCACALPLFCQSNSGELRAKVTDPSGLGVGSTVELVSEANQYHNVFTTDAAGNLVAKRLPFGIYRVQVERAGFASVSQSLDIHTAASVELAVKLTLAPVSASVTVKDADTLIDPYQAGAKDQIGSETIENRAASLPGRCSRQDLVNSQPGWLSRATPFCIRAVRSIRRNLSSMEFRSPITVHPLRPEIEADDVDSMDISPPVFPAEFGRKMGGVVEVNTLRDARPDFYGEAVLSGGSFDTAAPLHGRNMSWGKNTLARERRWRHDRPLPESCGSGELHEQRNDRRFFTGL